MNDEFAIGIKIELKDPESFLLVKETLTRIGVASNKTKSLYQSVNILHKRGEYYLVHFKELFILDGKESNISEDDLNRRNLIAKLLEDWGLVMIVEKEDIATVAPLSSVKIISYKDKDSWNLVSKYTVGSKLTKGEVNGNK